MTQSANNSNFQHTDKKDMEDLEKRKTIESFTLMDDIFMRLVFEEKSCTEYVLQVLMNKKSLKVKKQYVQKDLPNLYGHSSHRLLNIGTPPFFRCLCPLLPFS